MNLATRCHACGTVFRIVRDQLRVSDGWVRCGRCQAVFNATDDLFELDAGEPSLSTESPSTPTERPTATGEVARRVLDELAADRRQWQAEAAAMPTAWTLPRRAAEGLHDEVAPDKPPAPPEALEPHWHEPAPDDDSDGAGILADTEPDADALAQGPADALEVDALAAPPTDDGRPAAIVAWGTSPSAAGAQASAAGDAAAQPGFLRRADRAAFWRAPRVRAALSAFSAMLVLALAVQIGHAGRDPLAAQWPALQPALEALCDLTGCRISPLRQIDRLSVDSAGLTVTEGAPIYRLQVVLHNRADTALLAPALDLSLNDAQGVLVTRRVLQGAELGLPSPVIGAQQELPLTVTLVARDRRIAGYNVELFYP